MTEFDLKSLGELTGVSPRTVYFYVQQGLLPPPTGAGRAARYSDVHRDRLRLIRQLQDQHLPLAEIRKQIESLSNRDLSRLADGTGPERRKPTSAAEYIQAVLSGGGGHTPRPRTAAASLSARPPSGGPSNVTPAERSQWERIVLAPEIELHVRRPLSRVMNRKLDRLLEHAREVMKEQA